MPHDWLPPIVRRTDFASEEAYLNALYASFRIDFIDTERTFEGLPIRIKRHPPYEGIFAGKEATFRHLITDGKDEASRVIVPGRCERLGWVLPLIQRVTSTSTPKGVHVWENKRATNGQAYVIALSDFSYKVVLTQRTNYLLLWTQFPVNFGHSRQQLRRDYERSI